MKHTVLANGKSKSKGRLSVSRRAASTGFLLCVVETDGVAKDKVYRLIPDPFASKHDLVRIIDDSQEDYLYPAANFIAVSLPKSAEKYIPGPSTVSTRKANAPRSRRHPSANK